MIDQANNEFIQTDYASLNYSLFINPKAVWFNKEKLRKQLSKLSWQTNLKVSQRVLASADVNSWNPFDQNLNDTSLIANRSNIRNVLFINRGNPTLNMRLGQNVISSKQLQTTGFESRSKKDFYLNTQWNLNTLFSINTNFETGEDIRSSELAQNRNFNIDFFNSPS